MVITLLTLTSTIFLNMPYNYTSGDGKGAFTASEPASSDSIKNTTAQAIRQIKAWILDSSTAGAATKAEAAVLATAAQNAAIAANVVGKDLFKAKPTANQDVVHGAAGTINTDVTLGTEVFDLDSRFAASVFTAPANGYYRFDASLTLFLQTGSPTYITADAYISESGGESIKLSNPYDDSDTAQRTLAGGGVFYLETGDTVKLAVTTEVDAAATVRISEAFTSLSGYRIR